MDKRLADLLVRSGLFSRADMQRKILKSKATKKSVIEQIWDSDTDENAFAKVLAEYLDTPVVDERKFRVNSTALKFLSSAMAEKNGVLPFALSESADRVTVAIYDPQASAEVMKTLKIATGNTPEVIVARKSWIQKAIRHFYFGDPWAEKPTPGAQKIERSPRAKNDKKLKLPAPSANTIARLKPKRREMLTPIEMKLPMGDVDGEDSEEIILDEVSLDDVFADEVPATPPPRPQRKKKRPERKTKRKASEKKRTKKARHISVVDKALDDFDSFLEGAPSQAEKSGIGNARIVDPNLSDVPGWTSPPVSNGNNRSFTGWDAKAEPSGFDLFSEVEEEPEELDIQMILEMQTKKISQLHTDLMQQRDIIQALIDLLSESRIVSKREIKKRITK